MIYTLLLALGLQLPSIDPGTKHVQPLVSCFEAQGWTVEFLRMPQGYEDVYVIADKLTMVVTVNERLDDSARVGSLIYQMAYNHGPEGLGQRDRDLWAELVSYRVLVRLDLSTSDSIAYMRRFDRVESFALEHRDLIDAESASIVACMLMPPSKRKPDGNIVVGP